MLLPLSERVIKKTFASFYVYCVVFCWRGEGETGSQFFGVLTPDAQFPFGVERAQLAHDRKVKSEKRERYSLCRGGGSFPYPIRNQGTNLESTKNQARIILALESYIPYISETFHKDPTTIAASSEQQEIQWQRSRIIVVPDSTKAFQHTKIRFAKAHQSKVLRDTRSK